MHLRPELHFNGYRKYVFYNEKGELNQHTPYPVEKKLLDDLRGQGLNPMVLPANIPPDELDQFEKYYNYRQGKEPDIKPSTLSSPNPFLEKYGNGLSVIVDDEVGPDSTRAAARMTELDTQQQEFESKPWNQFLLTVVEPIVERLFHWQVKSPATDQFLEVAEWGKRARNNIIRVQLAEQTYKIKE